MFSSLKCNINRFILGNEALVSKCGYFAGSHLILNSGKASHGGGDNRGLSKALCMVIALFICPFQYVYDINWVEAWTPINMLHFRPSFRPILISLAKALDNLYWVSLINYA